MKLYDAGTIVLIVFVSLCAVGGFVSKHWLGDDNEIEEACEAAIEEATGYDIDLSFGSEEKK